MNPLFQNCEKVVKAIEVSIPSMEGDTVAEIIQVEVEVWRNRNTGEVFLDGHARAKLEATKARYLGLLTAEQIKELRQYLQLTQRELADLLQIGEKSWTRWETGRERPSRSINVLLNALYDGRSDIHYLRQLRQPELGHKSWVRAQAYSNRQAQIPAVRWETAPTNVSNSIEEIV